MSKRLGLLVSIGLLLIAVAPVRAEVYVAHLDFSTTSNPNGTWSYGFRDGIASTDFTEFSVNQEYPLDAVVGGWYQGWFSANTGTIVPYVAQNVDNVEHGFATIPKIKPQELVLHPGSASSVVRWTAPGAGTVEVLSIFTRLDETLNFESEVAVVHEGTSIFSGTITGPSGEAADASTFSVAANDRIDFVVGPGADGFTADSTSLSGTVNFTAVPEPATLVSMCVALGTMGLIVTIRRRKQAK